MKQYIKKALWIIPFVFSLNLYGNPYYFVGSGTASAPGVGSDVANWNSSPTATPSSSSGQPTDFLGSITLDFNGRYVDIADMIIENPTFINGSGATNVTITNTGTVFCISLSAPKFDNPNNNVTYNFSTSGEFYYCADNYNGTTFISAATITPLDYYNLTVAGVIAQTAGKTYVSNKLTLDHLNQYINVTRVPSLLFSQFQDFELKSTSSITVANSTASTANQEAITLSGTITDNRSSKTFPGTFLQNSTQSIQGTFYNLTVASSFQAGGNITVSNLLTTNTGRILTCSTGHVLTIKTWDRKTTSLGNTGYSRINILGQLTLTANISLDKDMFGSNNSKPTNTSVPPVLTDISILQLNSGVTLTLSTNLSVSNELIISSSSSFINLNNNIFSVNGSITNTNGANGGKFKGSSTSSLVCGATGTLYFNQSGTDNYLKNFTVNNSKTLTLGNTLNIAGGSAGNYGTVIIDTLATCSTGNNLVLKSTSGGTARIGKSPGTISGEYKVEQYIPGGDRDFRFLASPVVGGTAYQWRNEGAYTAGIGTHITGANPSTNSFDVTSTENPSAFIYKENKAGNITTINLTSSTTADDPGWESIAGGGSSNTLENGKGYRVFVRGDRGINLSATTPPTANATTLWVKGTYPSPTAASHSTIIPVTNSNRKDVNNRAYDNNGINFIGNPFPSAIDWNVLELNNVDNGYVVYDPTTNQFVGYNGTTGSGNRYISANQGFYVYCNSTSGGTITVNEWDKYDGIGGSVFLTKLTNHLKINLMYDSSYNSDTYLHFRQDAQNTRDRYDIPQVVNNGTNVATLDESLFPYNINSMGTIDSFQSIPLSVQGTPAASLKLSFFDIASFYEHKIELVDNYKKTTTPLTEAMIYSFDITDDSLSFKNGRFYLNFTKVPSASTKIIQTAKIATIYPNPVENNKINIELENKYNNARFEIINMLGQSMLTGNINKKKTIELKEFASGVYHINVESNGNTQSIQFIK